MPLPFALPGIAEAAAGFLRPIVDLIDELHTSDKEKGQLRLAMAAAQVEFAARVLDYEARVNEAQASILKAEAQGKSVLQRTWRPITMLTFLFLVVATRSGGCRFSAREEDLSQSPQEISIVERTIS